MNINIPEVALVLLVGPSGAGKSTFARKHFLPSEVLSSDHCRYLVSDDENNQAATADAFAVLRFIAAKRLAAGKLTVIDATNVQVEARQPLLALARQFQVAPVAIVLNVPECLCADHNKMRPYREFAAQALRFQCDELQKSLPLLYGEGFTQVFILDTPEQIAAAVVERYSFRPLTQGA